MRRSLRSWLWRVPLQQEVDEEIAFHVEMRTRELIARGMDPTSARETAIRRAGDVARLKRACVDLGRKRDREMRLTQWLEEFRHDVKFGIRQLNGARLFTAVAVLTLALGIGANAAVFGVTKSVLLDALPYADAERLTRVHGRRLDGSQERGPLSAGTIDVIAARQSSFDRLAAFVDPAGEAVYGNDDGSRIARIAWVDAGFFETLGVRPALGRTFRDGEGLSGLIPLSGGQLGPDMPSVVMLTHAAWQTLFAGDRGVLGRDVRINGVPRTVIGVLPREFVGPMGEADFYFAFDLEPVLAQPVFVRGAHWLGVVARLKPGVTRAAAQRDLDAIAADLARQYPQENGTIGVTTMPLHEAMVGDTRTPLLVLMASAALVLLIACANLAGALLSRTLTRRREFAVRAALGAGQGRLVRQLLTETTVLAVAGGAAGLLLAVFLLDLLRGLALPALPPHADLSLDGGAVLVMMAIALCTGVAFGVAPAVSAGRSDPQGPLRDESRSANESLRSRRLRGVLVAGQLALCLSLLVGAGLLARSLWAMSTGSLGFDPDGVLTATVQLPSRDYPTPEAQVRFHEQFTERLRTLPGVDAVALASAIPTAVRQRLGLTAIDGAQLPGGAQPLLLSAIVSDDYFDTLRIPVRRGRTFDARDRFDGSTTVVVNESMARRYWRGGDALGARIRIGPDTGAPLIEVVGIVGDVRNDRARPDAEPMVYLSSRQVSPVTAHFLLRAQGDPAALARAVEHELTRLDPGLPLQRATTMREVLGEGLASRRLPVVLMSAFGALALLLASVGVYAMFASMTVAREREFGVRMALGCRRRAIAGLVLQQGAGWMGAGLGAGALGVILVVRLVRDLLYGVAPFDPVTIGLSVAVLAACATVALLVPVRRATRVNPALALRAQ